MTKATIDNGVDVYTFVASPVDALSMLASSLGYQDVEVEPMVNGAVTVSAGTLRVTGQGMAEACSRMMRKMREEKNGK